MGSQALLTIVIIAGFFVVSGIIYLVVRPRREAAGTVVVPGEEFRLEAAPGNGKDYRLWLKYDLNWTGREKGYGLVIDLRVVVDGNVNLDRQLRMGAGAATEDHREQIKAQLASGRKSLPEGLIMPFTVRSSSGRQGRACYERATAAVCPIENRDQGSVISVTGTVRPVDDTIVNSLYAFIAR